MVVLSKPLVVYANVLQLIFFICTKSWNNLKYDCLDFILNQVNRSYCVILSQCVSLVSYFRLAVCLFDSLLIKVSFTWHCSFFYLFPM